MKVQKSRNYHAEEQLGLSSWTPSCEMVFRNRTAHHRLRVKPWADPSASEPHLPHLRNEDKNTSSYPL